MTPDPYDAAYPPGLLLFSFLLSFCVFCCDLFLGYDLTMTEASFITSCVLGVPLLLMIWTTTYVTFYRTWLPLVVLVVHGTVFLTVFSQNSSHLLCSAACRNNRTGMKAALFMGADVNAKKGPLHNAVRKDIETAEFLIRLGADVTGKDWRNMTPLHEAASYGKLEAVKLLIRLGADVNAKNNINETPLHEAAAQGELEVVEFLVFHGADVDAKEWKDRTPLYVAANYGAGLEVIQFLVSRGADVNAKNTYHETPLHAAASVCWFEDERGVEVVKFLVSAGADVHAEDENGRTPLDVAKQYGNTAMAEYFSTR